MIAQTIFRIMFSLIFIVAGVGHLLDPDKIVARLSQSSWVDLLTVIMPLKAQVLMSGVVLAFFGVCLLMGLLTRISALILFMVLIPITVTVQLNPDSLGPLFKNVALLGGLIHFYFFGPGGLNLDHYFLRTSKNKTVLATLGAGLCLFLYTEPVFAKEVPSSEQSVAILVREPRHLDVALMTVEEGKSGKDGLKIKSAEIVVCGVKGVEPLKKGSALLKRIGALKKKDITVVACGLSLKEAGLTAKDVGAEVQVVENGLWHMLILQNQGYLSIEL